MISIQTLEKRYGTVAALDRVSLELPAGSVTAILGPSGSGKTTLLRLIAGLEIPDGGQIELGGELASQAGWAASPNRRNIGFCFQTPSLWPHMTVAQNVNFGLLGRPRREIRERVAAMLEAMELEELGRRYPAQLSGGQARRVSIARTLVTEPQRLLLDEPLTHLDPTLKEKLLRFIVASSAEREATLLLVTHDEEEARQLNGRVLRLVAGRLAEEGAPA